MKRIVLITDFTPTIDNINGPSALCYYIFKELSKEHEILIYTTNANKANGLMMEATKATFKEKIKIIPRNLLMKILLWKKTSGLFSFFYPKGLPTLGRYRLPHKTVKEIYRFRPDLVVLYPMSLIGPLKQLKKLRTMVIGPDCFTLHYIRALKNSYYYKDEKIGFALRRFKDETFYAKTVSKNAESVALVGREDCMTFNTITNDNKAIFLPHPHYSLVEKNINLNKSRLKVIITGNYNEYTDVDVDIMVDSFMRNASKIGMYDFTFLGKSWGGIVNRLSKCLFVEHKIWVDKYVEELKEYDIQIFPICLGSGTKGKVLDAASTGLLCVGSYTSFENIALKPNETCLMYDNASEVPYILEDIYSHKEKYQRFALQGKENVRKFHDISIAVNQIKRFINGDDTCIDESPYLFIK